MSSEAALSHQLLQCGHQTPRDCDVHMLFVHGKARVPTPSQVMAYFETESTPAAMHDALESRGLMKAILFHCPETGQARCGIERPATCPYIGSRSRVPLRSTASTDEIESALETCRAQVYEYYYRQICFHMNQWGNGDSDVLAEDATRRSTGDQFCIPPGQL